MKKRKLLQKLLSGSKNIRFSKLINLQNVKGKAKPYQVKQLLEIIERYNLQMEDDG